MVAVTLDNTIGSAFLGTIAAAILFGITNLQMYLYFYNYPKDWRFQKIAVAVLWVLDALHLSLTIHAVYHYLITSFGNLLAQIVIVWSFKLQVAVNISIVLGVQSLYALRVWKLGHHFSRVWPWVVIASVAGGYAIGILLVVKTYQISTFTALHEISWIIIASFATSTSIDIIISIAMCFYLQRSRTPFVETNYRIVTVMRYVLASGALTSACSLAALITYATMPNNLIFFGIEFLLTKLYINSFLAMLNARRSIRETDATSSAGGVSRLVNSRTTAPSVYIHQETSVGVCFPEDKNSIPLSPTEYRRYEYPSPPKILSPGKETFEMSEDDQRGFAV